MPDIASAEETLLQTFCADESTAGAIFILGAPRTGSTFLYQAMVHAFALPYISNFTNFNFPTNPIVGLAAQNGIRVDIGFQSSFGKTNGAFQPSEGSAVLMNWFGGGHPSQILSTQILDGKERHFHRTLAATESLCGGPLLTKNPWNCFRANYLTQSLPSARFVWIRRDIRVAALSDLEARYITKNGDAHAWNSATPANIEQLLQLPPVQQVVENQIEFSKAISSALAKHAEGRWIEVWYEDLIADPQVSLDRIGALIKRSVQASYDQRSSIERAGRSLLAGDAAGVYKYVASDASKFATFVHPSIGGEEVR
jgi:hypothetical protein